MGESKPAWQIIRILAQWMSISGFEYKNIQHVLDEITCEIDQISDFNAEMPLSFENERFDETQILRIADWPMYRVDNLVRRATALQATLPKDIASIRLNTTTARRNNFAAGDLITAKQEGGQVTLPLVIDDRLADHSAVIPFGLEQTAGFGSAMAAVELVKELE
jgi:NADH-quinone oxidoreductase subunit G